MNILTQDAHLVCKHELGVVNIAPSQRLVTIEGRRVLVDDDPENRDIAGCPNVSAVIKPCLKTLKVQQGYSSLIFVQGKRACLDTVRGLTDGTPPGTVQYNVRSPGQSFVSQKG